MFFVVSGFCIHMSFQQQGQKWGDFFIRRFFRIYPAYLAALVFILALDMVYNRQGVLGHEDWMQVLAHLFLVHNFDPSKIFAINGSFWSLAIEGQLYLLYPALLVLVAKLGWRSTMVTLAACELLIRCASGLIQTVDAEQTIVGQVSWFLASSPLGYWFSWALGAFIADAHLKKQSLPFLNASPVWWLALAIISYFIKPLDPFRFLLFAVLTAVVTSQLLSGARIKIKVPAFSLSLLNKIGLWSYSIYLLHQPLLNIYSRAIDWVFPLEDQTAWIVFLFNAMLWLAIIPFSFLWYKIFELAGIALGKRIIQKSDADPMVGANNAPGNGPGQNGWAGMMNGKRNLIIGSLLVFAVGSLFGAAKLAPRTPRENNNLAWSLATDPEAAHRNGARAVELAEDACRRTQYKVTLMVGTLAAAYAEAKRFDQAIATAQQACHLAAQNGETNLIPKELELLVLYQNYQPYHEAKTNVSK